MNDRTRAQAILKEAKDILAQRLTEMVLAADEDLLADARGESYMNEMESLYEQVGLKLNHVNQMLANLPAEAEPPPPAESPSGSSDCDVFTVNTEPAPSADAFVADTTPAIAGPVFVATPALPAPKPPVPTVSFALFAARVQSGDLPGAGQTLAELLELSQSRARQCAAAFAERLRADPDFLRKAMELRGGLKRDSREVMLMLMDCLGLSTAEAQTAIQKLGRRRIP